MGAEVKVLTGAEIESVDDRKIELVSVPEWGGSVYVRSMMGDERDAFDAAGVRENGDEDGGAYLRNYRARLAVATVCDASGKLLFKPAQVGMVGKKNAAALSRIARVAQRLNALTADAIADEKKDSGEAPSDASPTASA